MSEIFNIYKETGIIGTVLILFAFVIMKIVHDLFKEDSGTVLNIMKKYKKIDLSLMKRKFLYIKNVKLKDIEIVCEKRKLIFIDFTSIRIDSFLEMMDLFESSDTRNMTKQELFYFIKENMTKYTDRTNNEALSAGIPSVVCELIRNEEKDEQEVLSNVIKNICFSEFLYKTNQEKITVICDFFCTILDSAIANLERSLDVLNGQLDGIIYRGISCDNCSLKSCNKYRGNKNV